MRRPGSYCWLICSFLLVTLVPTACRDAEPPPRHNTDLGDGELVLLPTAPVWHDSSITEGRAELHPFRELSLDEEPEADEAPAVAAVAGSDETGTIRSEIREIIDEYNDLVSEATVDELLDYYVEEQHDALRALFESAAGFAEQYAGIRLELEARLPDDHPRIDAALAVLEADVQATFRLPVESVTVMSESEAAGKIVGGSAATTCRFRLLDEEWYIELPGLDDAAELRAALDAGLTQYRQWLDGLRSGKVSPDAVLQQVEARAQVARAARADADAGKEVGGSDTAEEASEGEAAVPAEGEGNAAERVEPGGG